MTHIIQIGRRYYSARHRGNLVARNQATLFTQHDAEERASRIVGAIAVSI